jgi:hypothetical protein
MSEAVKTLIAVVATTALLGFGAALVPSHPTPTGAILVISNVDGHETTEHYDTLEKARRAQVSGHQHVLQAGGRGYHNRTP